MTEQIQAEYERVPLTKEECKAIESALTPVLRSILRRRVTSIAKDMQQDGIRWIAEWYHDELIAKDKAEIVTALHDQADRIDRISGTRAATWRDVAAFVRDYPTEAKS